jgi:hypothetical protein
MEDTPTSPINNIQKISHNLNIYNYTKVFSAPFLYTVMDS